VLFFKMKWNKAAKVKLKKFDPELHNKKEEDESETDTPNHSRK